MPGERVDQILERRRASAGGRLHVFLHFRDDDRPLVNGSCQSPGRGVSMLYVDATDQVDVVQRRQDASRALVGVEVLAVA